MTTVISIYIAPFIVLFLLILESCSAILLEVLSLLIELQCSEVFRTQLNIYVFYENS